MKTLFLVILLVVLTLSNSFAQDRYKEKIKGNKKILEFYESQQIDSLDNIIERHFKRNNNIELRKMVLLPTSWEKYPFCYLTSSHSAVYV